MLFFIDQLFEYFKVLNNLEVSKSIGFYMDCFPSKILSDGYLLDENGEFYVNYREVRKIKEKLKELARFSGTIEIRQWTIMPEMVGNVLSRRLGCQSRCLIVENGGELTIKNFLERPSMNSL